MGQLRLCLRIIGLPSVWIKLAIRSLTWVLGVKVWYGLMALLSDVSGRLVRSRHSSCPVVGSKREKMKLLFLIWKALRKHLSADWRSPSWIGYAMKGLLPIAKRVNNWTWVGKLPLPKVRLFRATDGRKFALIVRVSVVISALRPFRHKKERR